MVSSVAAFSTLPAMTMERGALMERTPEPDPQQGAFSLFSGSSERVSPQASMILRGAP